MTDLRKAAEMALEALEGIHPGNMTPMAEESWNKAVEALRQALAQPKREWVGLTDDDYNIKQVGEFDVVKFAKYIEAKLKEKNGG